MERQEAIEKITELVGKDLRPLADKYEVTVLINGKKNKGWAGQNSVKNETCINTL